MPMVAMSIIFFFFFFNDTATTEIYTLSLHDALPIYGWPMPHCFIPALPRGSRCNIGSAACPVHAVSKVRFAGRNRPSMTLLVRHCFASIGGSEDRYEEGNGSFNRGAAGRSLVDAAGRSARSAAGLVSEQLHGCGASRRYAGRDLPSRRRARAAHFARRCAALRRRYREQQRQSAMQLRRRPGGTGTGL